MTDLELHVLLAIAGGAGHGYAIGKDIEARSGGAIDPATGALYHALRRLDGAGLIEPVAAPASEAGDPRRRFFGLTGAGRRAAAEEVRRLESIVRTARARNLYPVRP